MFRNFTFLSRDNELKDIREALHPTLKAKSDTQELPRESKYGEGVACCILQGIGGIGKTQTALEYTFRYREDYDAIFWIGAEMGSSIASSYANLAKILGLIDNLECDEGRNQGQAIERTKKWLTTTGMLRLFSSLGYY